MTESGRVKLEFELEEKLYNAVCKAWWATALSWNEFIEKLLKLGSKHYRKDE